MTKKKFHKILGILLLIGLITPAFLIQINAQLPEIYIAGVVPEEAPIELSWFDGTQQKQLESTLFENTVVRAGAIRIRNQYHFSLFDKLNAQQIYEYDDYFYRFYVNNYAEDTYSLDDSAINQTMKDLIELQRLVGKDCPIISVIAPSKARLFPEHLPDRNLVKSKNTNYDRFTMELAKNNFTCLDFNDYFVKNKGKFEAAIIGKGGIHWTYYASSIAMDSLVTTVEKLKGTEYNHFSTTLSDCGGFNVDDQDISVLCNLIERQYDPTIKHVEFKQSGVPKKKINALIIGDSFFYTIENSDMRKLIFTETSDYLYYFERTHDANRVMYPLDLEKIKKQLKEVDCIIFLNDLVNMEKFTFGFPHKMIEELKKDSLLK